MPASTRSMRRGHRGSSIVEFTLVGIPMVFVLISIFEMSRGMWMYETIAHAVREGARYAVVHGQTCAALPNKCSVTSADVATAISNAAVGLDPTQFTVTISTGGGAGGSVTQVASDTLQNLVSAGSPAAFSSGSTSAPADDVVVYGIYPFKSALAMFWPGGGHTNFAVANLAATSRERIDF